MIESLLRFFLVLSLAFLLLACASSSNRDSSGFEPLYFPAPPDEPRFVFERIVRSSSQLSQQEDEDALRRLLTGETDSGVAMAKPFDVVSCQGQIFVSDTVNRVVMVFDVPGKRFYEIGKDKPGDLRKPLGLDTDANCNLYVADGTTRNINVYDQKGSYIKSLGGQKWFDRLSHVAVDHAGNYVYAVDTGGVGSDNHHIRVFDVDTGEHVKNISRRGNDNGELNLPRDIEVDQAGNIYIVDGGNFRIQVFNQDGVFVRSIGRLGRHYGQFARPKGLAVDADGNVYVSDAAHGNYQIFNNQGDLLLFVGTRSEKFDRATYMLPAGIDVDEDGRVYIIDQFFRKLDIYRPVTLLENEGTIGGWSIR